MTDRSPVRRTASDPWDAAGAAIPTGIAGVDHRVDALQDVERGTVSADDIPAIVDLDTRYGDLRQQLHRPTRHAILISRDGSAYRRRGGVWACVLTPGRTLLDTAAAGRLLGLTPATIGVYLHRPGHANPFPVPRDWMNGGHAWRRADLFTWHCRRPGNGHHQQGGWA